jgi:glutathione synthase/RimK-type ligase-like ATP-grasp enzyme
MSTIGFVATAEMSEMPPSDVLVRDVLEDAGHTVRSVRWDSDDCTRDLDAIIFRSCWNYHLHPAAFAQWVSGLSDISVPVFNSVETVLWNMDKHYLLDLAASVPVIPTELIENPDGDKIDLIRRERGWKEVVVKPTIGNTSYQNYRLQTPCDYIVLDATPLPDVLLVQPYLQSIPTHGEVSLIYFDGIYSHACVKRAAEGDYRVQEEFGGTTHPFDPSADMLELGERVLATLSEKPLYARVDLVAGDVGPMVMELELVEPELYLTGVAGGAERFAQAILSSISARI